MKTVVIQSPVHGVCQVLDAIELMIRIKQQMQTCKTKHRLAPAGSHWERCASPCVTV